MGISSSSCYFETPGRSRFKPPGGPDAGMELDVAGLCWGNCLRRVNRRIRRGPRGKRRQKEGGLWEESPRLPCSWRGPGRLRGCPEQGQALGGRAGVPRHARAQTSGRAGRNQGERGGCGAPSLPGPPRGRCHQHPARRLGPAAPGSRIPALLFLSLSSSSLTQCLKLSSSLPPVSCVLRERPANEQCCRLHLSSTGKGAA